MEEKNLSRSLILKKAFLATFCSFYFTFISLLILEFILREDKYSFDYWTQIWLATSSVFLNLIWFDFHFILLIIGFYFGIKNFKRGKKKRLFILPIIFLSTSLFFPGFLPIPLPAEGTFLPIYFSYIWKGFFSLLFFVILISTVFYFQKSKYLLKAVGITFLILFVTIPLPGKYFYEQTQEKLAKKGDEIIKKVKALKKEAIETGNPNLCEQIKEIDKNLDPAIKQAWEGAREGFFLLRYDYYDPCIEAVAIKIGDESLCERMGKTGTAEGTQEWCKKRVFIHNTPLCKEFSEEKAKENCLRNLALNTNNAEICKKLLDFECADTIAFRTKNPDDCELPGCVKEIALSTNNPEICEKEPWEEERDKCYQEFAKRTKNVDFCKKIKNSYWRADCIIDVAVSKNDSSLCNLIDPQFDEREECFEKFR